MVYPSSNAVSPATTCIHIPIRLLAEVQVIELLPIVGDHLVVFEGGRLLGAALSREPGVPQETIRRTARNGVLSAQTLHGPHGTQVLGGNGLAGCASLVNHCQGFLSSFNRSLGELGPQGDSGHAGETREYGEFQTIAAVTSARAAFLGRQVFR